VPRVIDQNEGVSDEKLVTDVLSGIAWIERAVARKAVDLQHDERLSGLTFSVDVGKTFEADYPTVIPPGMYTDVVVSAYVDGSIEGAHGVAWTLDLIRRGGAWEIDRGVTLHASDERDDVVERLPEVVCSNSRELVGALPSLVDEWLQMAIPAIPRSPNV
jgi:hypothetical protein